MGTKPPALSQIAIAVAFALSVFGFTLFVYKSFGGTVPLEAKGYRVHMLFGRDASQLTSNAEVRIAGVRVGKVVTTKAIGTHINATVQLEKAHAPLPVDAHAIVRSKTLLGETFIELAPGTAGAAKIPDGGDLQVKNVTAAQGLDEVLGSFDAPTRAKFKQFLNGLSESLDGRGADLNAAIGNAAPATADLRRVLDVLDAQRPALRSLLRDTSTTLDAISERSEALREIVTAGNDVLGATAARDTQLTATINALPSFLREARTFAGEAQATAAEAAPTLRTLQPVADQLKPALRSASRLAPVLQSTFRGIDPVISASKTGLPAATSILKAAKPLVDILYPTGRELVPVVQLLDAFRSDIVSAAANIGAATNFAITQPDGSKNRVLRVLAPIWTENFLGASGRSPGNRANAYPKPGGLALQATTGLEAFSCAGATSTSSAPPCLQQAPWNFKGTSRSFPHVERDAP